ncbi:MAG: hypothetical protein WC526_02065 [Patescibacteria group bacterium]
MKSKIFWGLIILILLASNVFLGLMYYNASKELEGSRDTVATQRYNGQVLNFLKMFIKQVIKSKTEIDFDTRLQLENSVRGLNDPEILAQWQKFVNSTTQDEAQANVKDLLELLVGKIYLK